MKTLPDLGHPHPTLSLRNYIAKIEQFQKQDPLGVLVGHTAQWSPKANTPQWPDFGGHSFLYFSDVSGYELSTLIKQFGAKESEKDKWSDGPIFNWSSVRAKRTGYRMPNNFLFVVAQTEDPVNTPVFSVPSRKKLSLIDPKDMMHSCLRGPMMLAKVTGMVQCMWGERSLTNDEYQQFRAIYAKQDKRTKDGSMLMDHFRTKESMDWYARDMTHMQTLLPFLKHLSKHKVPLLYNPHCGLGHGNVAAVSGRYARLL
jgi:hypothetical protein